MASLFSSLFGSTGSDKSDQLRQQALDAFNSIKTPELSQLQVQLQKYVDAGQLTPEQAESQLVSSNAFNQIATDPSNVGAQKQALQQLQNISSQGGLTAVDKAQLNDINDQENQQRQGQDQAILSNAKERGVGGSGIETVNRLVSQQNASNSAANAGTNVAAQAQTRALQALQAAGQLGGQIESQQYGEQAQKATAQNAIDQFNTQTANANNLYNTETANQAQAANLANSQNINNLNTNTANTQAVQNSAAYQQQYNDALAKAQGQAGIDTGWANQANSDANKEQAGNQALVSGALSTGASALGTAYGGPVGGAAANSAVSSIGNGNTTNSDYNNENNFGNFANGGVVGDNEPSVEDAYNAFVKKFCYGGSVKMADGGMVNIKSGKKAGPLPIEPSQDNSQNFTLKDPKGQPIGDFNNYSDAADFAQKVEQKQPDVKDYRSGGQVPGLAPVMGDSPKNDIVPAKLSPGEVVLPRTVVAQPASIPNFVNKAVMHNPTELALKRLRNAKVDFPRGQ